MENITIYQCIFFVLLIDIIRIVCYNVDKSTRKVGYIYDIISYYDSGRI